MKEYLITILCFTFLVSTQVSAQDGFTSFYSDTTSAGGSISASITPYVFESDTDAVILLSSSVQQPYEISSTIEVVSNVSNQIELKCAAYPNPATEFLILQMGESKVKGLSYQLFDLTGRMLESKDIIDSTTIIPMKGYSASSYILKVLENSTALKTFKIIKK